jgi:hypothetical protein
MARDRRLLLRGILDDALTWDTKCEAGPQVRAPGMCAAWSWVAVVIVHLLPAAYKGWFKGHGMAVLGLCEIPCALLSLRCGLRVRVSSCDCCLQRPPQALAADFQCVIVKWLAVCASFLLALLRAM